MALYLNEIFLTDSEPGTLPEKLLEMYQGLTGPLPEGVSLKGGPWFSNEDPRVIMVLDIADHNVTWPALHRNIFKGLIHHRRLTPIVDYATAEAALKKK